MSRADLIAVANYLSFPIGNLTDILTVDGVATRYTPKRDVSALRITVCMMTAVKFGFTARDANGTTTPLMLLNSGNDLVANRAYTFTIGVRDVYTYQFQMQDAGAASGKLVYMTIEEIGDAEL